MSGSGGIDGIDRGSDELLVLQGLAQRLHPVAQAAVGPGDGLQGHRLVAVLQVLVEHQGMIPFLLGLHLEVVGKAGQTNALEVVCKVQI